MLDKEKLNYTIFYQKIRFNSIKIITRQILEIYKMY